MRRSVALVGVGFFLLMSLAALALASGSPTGLTIVYSNNITGQVRPCPT